jgi:hypothetical protein
MDQDFHFLDFGIILWSNAIIAEWKINPETRNAKPAGRCCGL